MADEKKTYLINIESNLKKYAEEAAAAKKNVEELTIENLKLQGSEKATAAEREASTAKLKNSQEEYRKAQKLLQLYTAALSSETGSRKQLGEVLRLQEQALGKLGKAHVVDAQGIMRLNPLYIEQRKRIAETKQAIIDYDQALKDGRSNIGRYGESVKAALGSIGKSILSVVGPAALLAAAVKGIKDAFADMEAGTKFLSGAREQLKTFFQAIVSGDLKYAFGRELPKDVKKVTDLMDEIRKQSREELIKIAEYETKIKLLRLESVDASKSTAEQLALLKEAEKTENELLDYRIKIKEDELKAVQDMLVLRKYDTTLLNKQAELEAEIINIRGEKSLRIASRISALREKEISDQKKIIAEQTKIDEEFEKERKEIIDKRLKAGERAGVDEMKRLEKNYQDKQKLREEAAAREIRDTEAGFEYQRMKAGENIDMLQQILNAEYGAMLASVEYKKLTTNEKLLIDQQYTDASKNLSEMRIAQQDLEVQLIGDIAGSLSGLFGKQTIANKALSVAQALISTYLAGVKAMAELPPNPIPGLRLLTMASVIAAGLLQVKNILAVKVPGGGGESISAPTSITSSVPAQRTMAAAVGSTIFTQPQLTQTQLNAIPNQNLLTAQDIAAAISKLPAPIVTVEDYNAKVKSVNKVNVRANI